MLSLATSRSKKPSAPPDPNVRLGFGETATMRSFFFVRVWFWGTKAKCRPALNLAAFRADRATRALSK
jgi:hypothetical protein